MPVSFRTFLRIAMLAAVLVAPWAAADTTAGPSVRSTSAAADIKEEDASWVRAATSGAPRYRIEAEIALPAWDRPATIEGAFSIDWANDSPLPAAALPLRLYPNAPALGDGDMRVGDLTVDGVPVAADATGDGTVLEVRFPRPLAPGERTSVTGAFAATVPVDSTAAFGIYAVKPAARTAALGHWYPTIAGRDGAGWSLEPYSRNGDPIFSPAAFYDFTLRTPSAVDVVATGVQIDAARDGAVVERRFVAGPVRDVAVALGDGWTPTEAEVDGTRVRSWANPADAAASEVVLAAATAALRSFSRRYGPYPYAELDVVQMELAGAVGMEYPGLVLIAPGVYGSILGGDATYAETVVAHEVAHQWWYGIVGSNQHRHAFIDEGLAEFSGVAVFLEDRYDRAAADAAWEADVVRWWEAARRRHGDLVAHTPTDEFPDRAAYAAAVYPKAALGFAAIRSDIGDEAFFAALRSLVRRHAFGVVEPGDVRAAFESACVCNLRPRWTEVFETAAPPATPVAAAVQSSVRTSRAAISAS